MQSLPQEGRSLPRTWLCPLSPPVVYRSDIFISVGGNRDRMAHALACKTLARDEGERLWPQTARFQEPPFADSNWPVR
jgi:hypothetical protein